MGKTRKEAEVKPSIARQRLDKLYRNAGRHHVEAMRLLARTRKTSSRQQGVGAITNGKNKPSGGKENEMELKLPEPAYYGKNSVAFWRTINKLPSPHRETCYSLGTALQHSEGDLRRLIKLEISNAKRKAK